MVKKLKRMLSKLYERLTDWIFVPGRGVMKIVLILLVILLVIALVLGLVLGMVIGIPALALYLAFNWAVPVFGGRPTITYRNALGITILIPVVIALIHAVRK